MNFNFRNGWGGREIHITPYVFSMFKASEIAFLLLLYHIATLAPASASACATANPIPAPAPDTIAVRPLREKSEKTRSDGGGEVLSCVKMPLIMFPSMLAVSVVYIPLWGGQVQGNRRKGEK